MTPPATDFTGRKIRVEWTEHAMEAGWDWEYFHVLSQNEYGMLCLGIDATDSNHNGRKAFVFWAALVAVRLIDEPQPQQQPDTMTIRDRFACAAMAAYIGSYPNGQAAAWDDIAGDSYRMADAMMIERQEAQP